MRELTCAEALGEALVEALEANPEVVIIGAGFAGTEEHRAAFAPLRRFSDRVLTPPIAELGYCGIAIGAAMAGMRPVVPVGTASFIYEALPQLLNEAAAAHYGSAGQVTVPIVFHMRAGIRGAGGIQHSAAPQALFWNSPGLQIAVPSSPADMKGLMRTALMASNNPTIFIDHVRLQGVRGPVPDQPQNIPFGVGEVKRPGRDVTIVATSVMVPRALAAAATLARTDGIDAEVVDPRTLVPLDKAIILTSVAKTGRVVVADETQRSCGVAAEIAAIIADEGFSHLRAPIKRVAIPDVPISFSRPEEDYVTPGPEHIVAAVRALCR